MTLAHVHSCALYENRVQPHLENPIRIWKSTVFITQEAQVLSNRKSKINKNKQIALPSELDYSCVN